jgi:hypothetical protein
MPVSFDDPMLIHATDGCVTPSGPLGLAAGETALRLDIWIFQPGAGGAACMAFLRNLQGATWTMHPAPPNDHFGNRFRPGEANAKGLMVKRDAKGQIIVEQWDRPINLVDK